MPQRSAYLFVRFSKVIRFRISTYPKFKSKWTFVFSIAFLCVISPHTNLLFFAKTTFFASLSSMCTICHTVWQLFHNRLPCTMKF